MLRHIRRSLADLLARLFTLRWAAGAVVALGLALCAPSIAMAQQTIVYVDGSPGNTNTAAPSGANPGNSWTNAYKYLQDGITRAGQLNPADTNRIQVWVRGSSTTPPLGFQYRPDQGTGHTPDSRTELFPMRSFVRIYGGFAGTETGDPQGFAQRSPRIYRTTLTGEINNTSTRSDNCYHVVTAKATLVGPPGSEVWIAVDASAQLDGFYITAGNADGSGDDSHGGGVFVQAASPTFQNLTIYDNDATEGGGAHAEPTGQCGQIPDPAPPLAHLQYRSCAFSRTAPPRTGRTATCATPPPSSTACSTATPPPATCARLQPVVAHQEDDFGLIRIDSE